MPVLRLSVVSRGEHREARVACVPEAPYPLAADIKLGPLWLSSMWHPVHKTAHATTSRRPSCTAVSNFRYDGLGASAEVVKFCSRSQPALVAQEISVVADQMASPLSPVSTRRGSLAAGRSDARRSPVAKTTR